MANGACPGSEKMYLEARALLARVDGGK